MGPRPARGAGGIDSVRCVHRPAATGWAPRATWDQSSQAPAGSQGELLAYLRATYRLAQTGRHVSLEDYADGAGHLYHHFFLDRGRELGGRAHRTCRWTPFVAGQLRYRGDEAARIRAALNRQPELERVEDWEDGARYLWLDRLRGVTGGTVQFRGTRFRRLPRPRRT